MSAAEAIKDRLSGWFGRGAGVEATSALRVSRPSGGPDRLLCAAILVLTALGVVMVFSAGAAYATEKFGRWTYLLEREALYALAGFCGFALALRIDYASYRRWTYPLLFFTIVLLAGVFLFGTRVNNAVRWYRIGPLSFQPSELAKFTLALYLAVLLARKAEAVKTFSMGFLPPLLMTGVVVGLIVLQPDLGTSVLLAVMALAIMFVAGTRTSYIVVAVLLVLPVAWKVFILGKEWRLKRVLAFLEPWKNCSEGGYQLCESLITVGSGGVFGTGLGTGKQKLGFLPEPHNDFILATIGEELGFIGVLSALALFMVVIWRGLLAALRARDVFGSYLAFAITTLFGSQALFNMGVVLGLLPTKGLPLPFVSYGGTSLVVNLFMAGVLANISARNPEPRPSPLFGSLRARAAVGKNKRADRGFRVVVEVGAPRRPRREPAPPAPAQELEETPTEREERAPEG